ncbi:hypothetical protein [Mameliella alba]|uniref:Uncharacterized protein n=1 Tax=Mameliella alba TaxID=561184 RepID=A0A0B3S333_9RHOB|nr:hypothetical protein [Mameliella alba]KHQ51096.1 hypothetical protein OA50_04467 [Mameliella alba]
MKGILGNRAAGTAPKTTPREVLDNGSVFGRGLFTRGEGGILPARGSDEQLALVKAAVQAATRSSAGSGSPLLAFLSPMLGGAALTRAAGLSGMGGDAALGEYQAATGVPDEAMDLLRLLENPNMPDAAKKDIARRFGLIVDPPKRGSRRGGAARPQRSDAKPETPKEAETRLFGTDGAGPDVTSAAPLAPPIPGYGPEIEEALKRNLPNG